MVPGTVVNFSSNVEKLGAATFAITGSSRPNSFALLGYTGLRERIFVSASDRANFQDALDEVNLRAALSGKTAQDHYLSRHDIVNIALKFKFFTSVQRPRNDTHMCSFFLKF